MSNKHHHLNTIQGVVNRLANNSFFVKGWAVTLVTGILALASAEGTPTELIWLALLPVVAFWVLDGYFLWQERLFRAVYNDTAKMADGDISFLLDIRPFQGGRNTWWASIFSVTLNIFYGMLIGLLLLVGWGIGLF